MGFYDERILPHLIHLACGTGEVSAQRERVVPLAEGRVLEIGMGSGLNLPFYDRDRVEVVWGLEPSAGMRAKAAPAIDEADLDVRMLEQPAEQILLDDSSVDTVVLTYTLCSIADWGRALDEMRRVLRPSGTVVFSEHGLAPDESVRRWQRRLNPIWKTVAGGCHLDRAIVDGLERHGFRAERVAGEYRGRPHSASYTSWGVCTVR